MSDQSETSAQPEEPAEALNLPAEEMLPEPDDQRMQKGADEETLLLAGLSGPQQVARDVSQPGKCFCAVEDFRH